MRSKFVFDPMFDENLYKASYKSKSSLRPVFDAVRETTDKIYFAAADILDREAGIAEGEAQALRDGRFKPTGKYTFNYAKARAAALRLARNSLFPTMEYDGKEIHGRVTINRRGGHSVEFGGPDPVAEVGKGTGEYVNHPAYAPLRRGMERA